jgi:hypothetical protein
MKHHPWQGMRMTGHLELISRAALCRQLARREPESRIYWLAEAETWSRLSRQPIRRVRIGDRDPLERFPDLIDPRAEAS